MNVTGLSSKFPLVMSIDVRSSASAAPGFVSRCGAGGCDASRRQDWTGGEEGSLFIVWLSLLIDRTQCS